jgi:hypothetical protein
VAVVGTHTSAGKADMGKIEIETIGQQIVLTTPVSFDDVAMTTTEARLLAEALLAAASAAEDRRS